MSSDDEFGFFFDDDYEEDDYDDDEASSIPYNPSSRRTRTGEDVLWDAIQSGNDTLVYDACNKFRANVNVVSWNWSPMGTTPLLMASEIGNGRIVGTLLNLGANAQWQDGRGSSAILVACDRGGDLMTVQELTRHDMRLMESSDQTGMTPLHYACRRGHLGIVHFLLETGANFNALEARDRDQQTALHHAAYNERMDVVRELILHHNSDISAANRSGRTPFDLANGAGIGNPFLEIYGNKLIQDHDRLALPVLLNATEYAFPEDRFFHPPRNPLQICLPLGKLILSQWRILFHTLDTELIHNRDDEGKLPIHIACRKNAPVEVLSMIVEVDPATLHIPDSTGALPLHECCCGTVDYSSVRYLVEQGGVGTLAARNREGFVPLHLLCGSTNPSWRTVQYLLQSSPGSASMRTNAGEYPFVMAATSDSSSLSVVYELVRANPGLLGSQ